MLHASSWLLSEAKKYYLIIVVVVLFVIIYIIAIIVLLSCVLRYALISVTFGWTNVL